MLSTLKYTTSQAKREETSVTGEELKEEVKVEEWKKIRPPHMNAQWRVEKKRMRRQVMPRSCIPGLRKAFNAGELTREQAETHLFDVACYRLRTVMAQPYWRPAEFPLSFSSFGEHYSYNDPSRWLRSELTEHWSLPVLANPLMCLHREEAQFLWNLVWDSLVMSRWMFRSQLLHRNVHSHTTAADFLYEAGYMEGRSWSMYSPIPQVYNLITSRRVCKLLLKRTMQETREWNAFEREVDEFVAESMTDKKVFEAGLARAKAWDTHMDRMYGDLRRCRACREKRVVRCVHKKKEEAEAQSSTPLMEHLTASWQKLTASMAKKSVEKGCDDIVKRAMIGLPICLTQMWRHKEWPDWVLAITAYVNSLGLIGRVAKWIVEKCKETYDRMVAWCEREATVEELARLDAEDDREESFTEKACAWFARRSARKTGKLQMGGVDADQVSIMVGVAGGLLTLALACLGVKAIPTGDKDITSFMTRFSLIGRMMTSAEMLVKAGDRLTSTITRLFRVYILKQDPASFVSFYEMHAWCEKVSKLVNAEFETKIKYNATMKAEYETLMLEGENLLKRLDSLKVPYSERTLFAKMYDQMVRVRPIVASSGAGCAQMRQTPVVVHLVGDSGTGKSSVLWPMFADVAAHMGYRTTDAMKQLVYFRYANDSSKFWDGYHNGVKICVVDDIFTKKDMASSPNYEVDEVIRMGNNAYWPLPMANLSDKGTTYFRAPLVIWTSNREHYDFSATRTNAEAIVNRITLRYRVKPKDQFAQSVIIGGREVNMLLKTAVTKALAKDAMAVKEFVTFQKLNPQSDATDVLVDNMTYDEMVADVLQEMDQAAFRFEKMELGVAKYFESLIARGPRGDEAAFKAGLENAQMRDQEQTAQFGTQRRCDDCTKSNIAICVHQAGTSKKTVRVGMERCDECTRMSVGMCEHSADVQGNATRENAMEMGLVSGPVPIDFSDEETDEDDEEEDYPVVLPIKKGKVTPRCTWFEWRSGLWHYNLAEMVQALGVHACSSSDMTIHIAQADVSPKQAIKFETCLVLDGKLTEKEQIELVRHIVRFGPYAGLYASDLSFYSRMAACHCGEGACASPTISLSSGIVEKLNNVYVKERGRAAFERRCEQFVAREDKAPWFSMLKVVVAALVGCLSVYLGFTVTQTIAKKICARTILEEELERCPVGVAHSRGEQTPGRAVGHVEAKERGEHSEECLESLAEAVRQASWTLFADDDGKSTFQQRLRELARRPDYVPWKCECGGEVQSVMDQNAQEVGMYAMQNLYKIDVETQPGTGVWTTLMNVLFVKGRMALANRHLVAAFTNPNARMRITSVNRPKGYEFFVKDLRYMVSRRPQDEYKDLMMIEFPMRVHQHRDITDKFVTAADLGRAAEYKAICITGHAVVSHATILRQYFGTNAVGVDGPLDLAQNGKVVGEVRHYIKYKIQTVKGDCGALVVCYDQRLSNKIIGIHAGGLTSGGYSGFAQPVTQETVGALLNSFTPRHSASKIASEPPPDAQMSVVTHGHMIFQQTPLSGDHMVAGELHMGPHRSYDTKIRPSPVHGVITEPTTAPAVLGPVVIDGVKVDPMDKAREKVEDRATIFIDNTILGDARDAVERMICAKVQSEDRKVVPLSVAIAGVVGDEAYPPINRKSSAGYGWSGTKKKWLGEDEYVFDHPEVTMAVAEAEAKVRRGERLNAVFIDTLKDERRDLARVAAAKTRLFSAGEMIFTLVFRMFFLGFAAHMWRRRGEVECCVGLNDKGIEWHEMALDLQSKGSEVVAGDFSNYDGSLPPELLWAVLDVINKFYGDDGENFRARVALWSDVVNSWHVSGRTVYMWSQSNPSGCPVTSILNSVAHSIAARYVWVTLSRKMAPEFSCVSNFRGYVCHRNYGDDDVYNISGIVSGWFNQESMTHAFKELGMTYTDEQKTGVITRSRKLKDVEFLKRSFRWEPLIARWVAPLRLGVILEMPMWVHSTSDEFTQTAITLKVAEEELALHSEEVYDREMIRLERAAEVIRAVCPVEFRGRRDVLLDRRIKEMSR